MSVHISQSKSFQLAYTGKICASFFSLIYYESYVVRYYFLKEGESRVAMSLYVHICMFIDIPEKW